MNRYPRSPHDKVGGIVYFGRMLDKIRLHAARELHPDLVDNLGIAFDKRVCDFLGVDYAALAERVNQGLDDEAALAWCHTVSPAPSPEKIEYLNTFMIKRGWRDSGTATLVKRKAESGFADRDDIVTMFDYIDADEGRELRRWW